MLFAFDLISDLHIETWPGTFDWTNQATAPICVVAGDIARDLKVVRSTLKHLSECYAAVFYIDGNDEHRYRLDNLGQSYRNIARAVHGLDRVTYLQDNVVVIDGVAILGTNGWWGFDFTDRMSIEESQAWVKSTYEPKIPNVIIDTDAMLNCSKTDAAYMFNSIQRLQTHSDVKKIIMVTHTVPGLNLVQHDISLNQDPVFNCMGNNLMNLALRVDTEQKIHTWCFGHYHAPVDRIIDGVRYVNNCRGRGDTPWRNSAYYPKRIELEF
jgi:predicted phosphodiesterase